MCRWCAATAAAATHWDYISIKRSLAHLLVLTANFGCFAITQRSSRWWLLNRNAEINFYDRITNCKQCAINFFDEENKNLKIFAVSNSTLRFFYLFRFIHRARTTRMRTRTMTTKGQRHKQKKIRKYNFITRSNPFECARCMHRSAVAEFLCDDIDDDDNKVGSMLILFRSLCVSPAL